MCCRTGGSSNPATRRSRPNWNGAATAPSPRRSMRRSTHERCFSHHSRESGNPEAGDNTVALGPRLREGDEVGSMTNLVDFSVRPEARPYIEAFDRRAGTGEPDWLARDRRRGLSRFAELGFPNRKSESWRYLDLQPLEKQPLLPAHAAQQPDEAGLRERLAALSLPERARRPGLGDGRVAPGRSIKGPRPRLWAPPQSAVPGDRPRL